MYNFKFMAKNEIEELIEAGKNELEKRKAIDEGILAEGDSALLIIEDIAERVENNVKSLGYELFIGCGDDEVKIDVQYTANKNKKSATIFEIKGRGWGHSVGMSQNGAIGMANNDFSCEEIIKWYYRGVEIE